MRKLFFAGVVLACLSLVGSSAGLAADKGGPSPNRSVADMLGPSLLPSSVLSGCYLELSASGQFLAAGDRVANGGFGVGCDAPVSELAFIGSVIRMDLGEAQGAEVMGKAGFLVNPHLSVYGTATWRMPNRSWPDKGQLYLGLGAETSVINDQTSVFVEGSHSVTGISGAARDDMQIRVGAKWRLPGAR